MTPLVKQILRNRGYVTKTEIDAFLNPDYNRHIHDPFLLPDMQAGVERILEAIEKRQKITVYGDYDIDGLSASALLLDALTQMGARIDCYIPDRFEEGYGINTAALRKIKKGGASLVISVDCGSTSIEPITWAAGHGLDVIVTDHHECPPQDIGLPPAVAVINPKRHDSRYPFKDLAGVGVAFKLVQGLQKAGAKLEAGHEKWLLDLVALGTVCDVVTLRDENRALVHYGLKVFAQTHRVGFRALAAVAGIDVKDVDTYHFGFVLGPRLNAAGRLEHAKLALELFTATDKSRAFEVAHYLEALNTERRAQQSRITEGALRQAEALADYPVLVLADPGWSHGIVGIVASKMVETFEKPAILLQIMGEDAKGSARSLGSFSIVEAMRACDKHLTKYGGHHVAAGCSLKTTEIDAFRDSLKEYYQGLNLGKLSREITAEADLADFTDLTWETYHQLEALKPFGNGNSRPLLHIPQAKIQDLRRVGADGKHLKLRFVDGKGKTGEAIAFGQGDAAIGIGDSVGVWFEFTTNTFRNQTTLQLQVRKLT